MVRPEVECDPALLREIEDILTTGQLTNATRVLQFEKACQAYLQVPHCVAVSSCTSGLMLVLKVLNVRGEVIVPSFTFHATAHSIAWNGLKPVFADCDAETFSLDPRSVRTRISPNTGAILAVHLFGVPAAVHDLEQIAASIDVPLVFDAAHAFGSRIGSTAVGSFGTAEVFSFTPTKLVVAGEGGLIATSNADLAKDLRSARNYGDSGNYDPEIVGLNARMSEFNAALGMRGIESVEKRISLRNEIRLRYEEQLSVIPGVTFQEIPPGCRSACKDLAILVNEQEFGASRDTLFATLANENISLRKYFDPPVHRQKLYRWIWDGQPLPATEYISSHIISLPIYSRLAHTDVDRVADAISRVYRLSSKHRTRGRRVPMELDKTKHRIAS
jgi:dTDP-4-amino-4,6-dideoxygalactose transaminase